MVHGDDAINLVYLSHIFKNIRGKTLRGLWKSECPKGEITSSKGKSRSFDIPMRIWKKRLAV
jgi:hypothetical protein